MNLLRKEKNRNERAQVFVLFALSLPVLIAFAGVGVDLGFAYLTKARLSRAVDAAALAGMRTTNQGAAQAKAMATDAFNANYGLGTGQSPPVLNVTVTTDANNNAVVNISATATINTFFLRVLPGFKTLAINSGAQATRPKLIMSLVLDRSGSMNLNGGAQALPPAITEFLGNFDDATDHVAMVSFSSTASVDVAMGTNFTSPMTKAVNRMSFSGATFSQAGLQDGLVQINTVPVAPGENVAQVAVFFTDGWANTIQDTLNCPPAKLLNYGGCSPPESAIGWCGNPPSNIFWMDPNSGATLGNPSCNATQLPSQQYGNEALTQLNVANEAMYRAIQVANTMRSQNIVVYSIGLGNTISQSFLQQVANDPNGPNYNPNEPQGEAVFAPTAADLESVFQLIASKILLRLSQ